MKITQKLVAEVKRKRALTLHDQAWHDFMAQKEVEAVEYAISQASYGDTPKDIVAEAKRYMEGTTQND